MDWYTKNALWVYWMRGDDEVVLSNKEASDLKDENNDDEYEIAKIFRIETNLFDYETPLCTKFNEFNYLLKVDTELFTHDGVPYEICDHICEPFCFKNGKTMWPTDNSNKDGFRNGGELLGMVRVGYMTYFQDDECYDDLMDSSLKEESLKQKAIYEKNGRAIYNIDVQEEDEQHKKGRCDLFDDPAQEPPVYKIRRFEMIKYLFVQEEEYVAINEYEYDDFTRTNEDACHAYQEIFRNMDDFLTIPFLKRRKTQEVSLYPVILIVIYRTVKHPKGIAENVLVGIGLRERMELDLEARLMGETLILNRSFVPIYGDYIELNNLNEPLEPRRNRVDDLEPIVEKLMENMDIYPNRERGDVIIGEPFCKVSCVEARRFDGLITIHNGDNNVTYQMVRSHPRFKHLSNEKCNKIPPLLKVSAQDEQNEISHSYQKLKTFYKGILDLGTEYIRDEKIVERHKVWLVTRAE
ncbi:hypothetical protein Tco_0178451 [Tanacetum coccineum]